MASLIDIPALRSFIWRLGRRLYRWARREDTTGPGTNGEFWLLAQVITRNQTKAPVFVDIGAHVGNWSEHAALLLNRQKIAGHIHAFEPASSTFDHLSERFRGNDMVSTRRLALSDRSGNAMFFVNSELCGTNTLLWTEGAKMEDVPVLRFDEYMVGQGIEHVLFVKSDAEGHDLNILMGAGQTLAQGLVDIWQFEYNHRWIGGRLFLKDVFDFIADKPYRIGKLHKNGIEIYEAWHPELERFFESNYVLVRKGSSFDKLCSGVNFDNRNVLVPCACPCEQALGLNNSGSAPVASLTNDQSHTESTHG